MGTMTKRVWPTVDPISEEIREILRKERRLRGLHYLRDIPNATQQVWKFLANEGASMRVFNAYFLLKGLGYDIKIVPTEGLSDRAGEPDAGGGDIQAPAPVCPPGLEPRSNTTIGGM